MRGSLWLVLAVACWAGSAAAQEPVVARIQMQFKMGDEVLDTIEKGDLLAILGERPDAFRVQTYNGKRGWVQKVNVLKLAESVETYDELIKAAPAEGRLYTLRGAAWSARGDDRKALADFDKAIATGYKEPHVYGSRGLFYASLKEFDKALADYAEAIKGAGNDDGPFINRAAVYMATQKYELALKDYDEALRRDDKKSTTFQQRAIAWKLLGRLDRAVEDFTKAVTHDPKNVAAVMGRGFVWFQLGQHQKAVDDFTEVIRLAPDTAQAFNNRGYNRQLLGEYRAALGDFEEAVRLAPEFALAYQNQAWLLAACADDKVRNASKAIVAATRACELRDYKSQPDVKALAAAFAEARQFDKAIGWQEKAIELAPPDQRAAERAVLEKYQAKEPFRLKEAAPPEDAGAKPAGEASARR